MNKNLELAIRYLKHRGFDVNRPDTEYAALSDLTSKTVKRNKADFPSYYAQATAPSLQEASELDQRLIEYLFSGKPLNCFKDVLAVLCGYLLVYRRVGLKTVSKRTQIIDLGAAYIDVLLRVLSRKDSSKGVAIHSDYNALRYLKKKLDNQHRYFSSYFATNNAYFSGVTSKRYTLARQSQILIRQLGVILKKNLDKYVHLLGKHMEDKGLNLLLATLIRGHRPGFISNDPVPSSNIQFNFGHPPYICLSDKWTSKSNKDFLFLSVSDLSKLSLPSLLNVLGISLAIKGTIIVPTKDLSSSKNQYGRSYNVFTRLRSTERKALGYINYDISGGIQIISFGILYKYAAHLYQTEEDLIQTFPLIFSYGWDAKFKNSLRRELSKGLGIPRSEVKALLTAYANGSNKNAGTNQKLQQFKEESDRLRREVISVIATHEPKIKELAESQSRHTFPEDYDWESTAQDEDLAREKASVYFFIWTYFEKQIRDAMLSVVDDGIPVHDAVYSKRQLPFGVFEQAVLERTGFQVKISH